jgi:hypothetical protein
MEVVITQNEQELERLERIIRENAGAFYEIGDALTKIRVKKYYHDVLGYETFEEYCRKRWDFSRIRAFQLIQSVEIRENVLTIVNIAPATESQCRPLARLPADQQLIAWQRAVETAPDGKVTAAHVYKIVKGMTMDEAKPKKEPKKIEITEAMGISTFIICHMKRIREDDPKRDEALKKILNWCKENIGGGNKYGKANSGVK